MAVTPNSTYRVAAPFPFNWTNEEEEGSRPWGGQGDLVQGALLVVIATFGAALNVFLMLAILPNPRMRSVRQVLLVHLAVVGLLTSLLLTLPAGIVQLVASLQDSAAADLSSSAGGHPASPSSSSSASQTSLVVQPHHAVFPVSADSQSHDGTWQGGAREGGEGVDVGGGVTMTGPMCTVMGAAGILLTAGGVWTLAALAWDKHRAIANPLHHPLVAHRQTMAAWFAALWAIAAALAAPPIFGGGDLRFVPALSRCGMHAGSERGRWHSLVVVALGIVAPLALMLYCYAHIFRIARAQSSRIAATMLRMVTLIQAPVAPPPARNAGMVKLRGTRAMATIVQLVGSCVASYVPWAVLLCHQAITSDTPSGLAAATAAILLHAAPLTAATVYGLRNRNLRASFARFVHRKVQQWCRGPHRRRPSVKSLTRNSSSAMLRKQAAQNGLSPSFTAGLRRTFSWQNHRRGMTAGGGGQPDGRAGQGNGTAGQLEASEAFLPRPHSYNVLTSAHPYHNNHHHNHNQLAVPLQVMTRDGGLFMHEPELSAVSDYQDVLEMNSEFPRIESDMHSGYPGIVEREFETVT